MKLEELKAWLEYSRLPKPAEPESDDIWGGIFDPLDFVVVPHLEHVARLSLFRDYLETMEKFLERERQEHEQKLDDEFKKAEGNLDYGGYLSWLEEMIDGFADTLRKSFFVNLYGYWESQLFPLCCSLKELDDSMPSPGEAKDFSPKNAKAFLDKIGFPTNDGTWQVINDYRILRNCIAHHNGEPDRMTKELGVLEKLLRNEQPLLSLEEGDFKKYRDVLLNEMDVIFVREGRPQVCRRQDISRAKEISFRKGDVLLVPTKIVATFTEDVTLQEGEKRLSGNVLRALQEGEKLIFRDGKMVVCKMSERPKFEKREAVICREGEKVIFRQKFIPRSEIILNKGFCEKALTTIEKYFDELLAALGNYGKTIKAA